MIELSQLIVEPKIAVKKNYILVENQESEYLSILQTLGRLFQIPEYPFKNVIWVFRKGPLKTTYDELYKLKKSVMNKLPKILNPNRKAAIVVETGLLTAMATEYTKLADDLPGTFKVFSDLKAAKDWIIEK